MKIKTYDSKKGYEVTAGELDGDTFVKEVNRVNHYFRLVSGYGIQADVFDRLVKEKVAKIVIKETDTGDTYESDLEQWKEHQGKGNWGHGRQYVLSDKYMQKVEPVVSFCCGSKIIGDTCANCGEKQLNREVMK